MGVAVKLINLIPAAVMLSACAAAPPPVAAPEAARAPLNGNMVRSAVAPTSDADKDVASFGRTQGFRLTKVDSKVMWCKREAEIGSHLSHNNCISDDTLVEMRRVYEANKQDLMNATMGCNTGSCGQK